MSCQRTGLSAKRPLTSKFANSGKIFVKIRSVDLRAVLLTEKATDKPKDKQKNRQTVGIDNFLGEGEMNASS